MCLFDYSVYCSIFSFKNSLKRRLTAEHGQDPAGAGDLAFWLVGGRADLDALESEQGDDHGAEAEQQSDDHQSPTRLHVNCTGEETQTSTWGNVSMDTNRFRFPVRQEVSERGKSDFLWDSVTLPAWWKSDGRCWSMLARFKQETVW